MVASSNKSEVFDPYLKWLGIRSPSRPPHHYDLLGLSLFESDADAIAAAAERQMAHVRRYQNGPYSALSQKILNQLAAAKICLLKPDEKARYDEQLRAQLEAAAPSTGGSRGLLIWGAAGALAVLVAAVLVWFNRPDLDDEPQPLQAVAQTTPQPPAAVDDPQVEVVDQEAEPDTPLPAAADSVAPWDLPDDSRPPAAPKNRAQRPLERAIQQALYDRDLAKARKAYNKLAAAEESLDSTAQARVQQYDWIVHLVEWYWKSVPLAAEDPKLLNDEIRFRGVNVKVSGVTDTTITLTTTDGASKQFSLARREMNPHLANALVRWRLGADSPKADMIIGATLAYDRQGDLNEFFRLMKRAQSQGQPVEEIFPLEVVYAVKAPGAAKVDQTPDELDPPVAVATSEATPPETTETNAATAIVETAVTSPVTKSVLTPPPVTPPASRKHPVPAEATRRQALDAVRELLASEYAAKGAPQKIRLAEKLLQHAHRAGDNLPDRYVLYEEAARLGIETGQPQLVATALMALEHHFDVDIWPLRREAIQQSLATVEGAGPRLALMNQCREGIDHFLAEDDFESAERFGKLLIQLSKQTREPLLKNYAKPLRGRVRAAERAHGELRERLATLAQNPDDPQANREVGFYCLEYRQDFDEGMRHLAKGSDDQLATIAQLALQADAAPDEVADQLWDWGTQGKDRDVFLDHAVRHYAMALREGTLSGMRREQAERRILDHQASLLGGSAELARLIDREFTFDWSDGNDWKSWRADQQGIMIKDRGPTWRTNSYELDRSVRFLSKHAKVAYVLVEQRSQVLAQAFDVTTGHLKAVGLGQMKHDQS